MTARTLRAVDRVYHLAVARDWEAAQATGRYAQSTIGRSLADEGFIHCSFSDQVATIARTFYARRDDVLVLTIDPRIVDADVRVEMAPDAGDEFPHIYGPLPVAAVVSVQPLADFLR